VADTGVGMPGEVVQRVFEPFFTTKPRGQGTGLGLSVVQGIVRAHGGDIRILSEVGRGTTVEIDLPTSVEAGGPKAEPVASAGEGPAPQQTPPSGQALGTVVLAEDNRAIRQMFATALRQRGISVLEAEDGFAFMEQVAALAAGGTPILAYILDIDMPGRSGTECLRLLRERGDQSPAIIISGGPMEVPSSLNAHCLPKPFTSSDLVKALSRAVQRPL
jgi:two-component system cell cycle sensor histidine kinase/response regulator CckA